MDIAKIGSSGRLPESAATQPAVEAPGQQKLAGPRADRLDLTSEGQLATRALESLRGSMAAGESGADPARLQAIRGRLESGYYNHPDVRGEIADRLGGLIDFGSE